MGFYSSSAVLNSAFFPCVSSGSLYFSPRRRRTPFFFVQESLLRRRFCCKCTTIVEKSPRRFNWVDLNHHHHHITEEQEEAISRIPVNMSKRCQALMKQIIICFSEKEDSFCCDDMLAAWVKRMKPIRADWLSLLKHLNTLDSPFYIKVTTTPFSSLVLSQWNWFQCC